MRAGGLVIGGGQEASQMPIVHVHKQTVIVEGLFGLCDAGVGKVKALPVGGIDFVDLRDAHAALAIVIVGSFGRRWAQRPDTALRR